jgi:hypothetical protein
MNGRFLCWSPGCGLMSVSVANPRRGSQRHQTVGNGLLLVGKAEKALAISQHATNAADPHRHRRSGRLMKRSEDPRGQPLRRELVRQGGTDETTRRLWLASARRAEGRQRSECP